MTSTTLAAPVGGAGAPASVASGSSGSGLRAVRVQLAAAVAGFDADLLSGADVLDAVEVACEIERLASAIKLLGAARIEDTRAYSLCGERSTAGWLAKRSGLSVGEAARAVTASTQLPALAATSARVRQGRLSTVQAVEVTGGATADRAAEELLLGVAARCSVAELRAKVRDVKAKASPESAQQRYDKIRAERALRSWVDGEGAHVASARTTVDDGALIDSVLDPIADRLFREAHAEGRREPAAAYRLDALIEVMRLAAAFQDGELDDDTYNHFESDDETDDDHHEIIDLRDGATETIDHSDNDHATADSTRRRRHQLEPPGHEPALPKPVNGPAQEPGGGDTRHPPNCGVSE